MIELIVCRLPGMQEPFNISLYPGTGSADGQRGDHILLAPAYNITEAEVALIVETTTAVVKQYFRKYGSKYAINGRRTSEFVPILGRRTSR